MLGIRILAKKSLKDEAEKPFWISFADLMTALMVMFLLVMSVALLAVTKTVSEVERAEQARRDAIEELLTRVEQATKSDPKFEGIRVHRDRQVIDFQDKARFDTASSQLNRDQSRLLRAFIPHVLEIADSPLGKSWLKRIVVEGFADKRGTYLFNLNLSLQRSQRVLCVLLSPPEADEKPLSNRELQLVRQLFLVGGYSSNSQKKVLEESRRIELRLEFRRVTEDPNAAQVDELGEFGRCAI
jgi:outer membrane protein OmpA-like peptidoglycan-associated protein